MTTVALTRSGLKYLYLQVVAFQKVHQIPAVEEINTVAGLHAGSALAFGEVGTHAGHGLVKAHLHDKISSVNERDHTRLVAGASKKARLFGTQHIAWVAQILSLQVQDR